MEPLIYYFREFWEFCLGDNLDFIQLCKDGDAVGILALIGTVGMVWGFFLRPIYRLVTGRKARGRSWKL